MIFRKKEPPKPAPFYTDVTNPIYARADNSMIDCCVTFTKHGMLMFTATANDSEEHGKQIWKDLIAGKYGPVTPYKAG
jgi:hypothetical protein